MHIFLKLIDGRTKDLDLEGTDTIALVRTKVAAVTDIHPEHQRLVFGDVELLDDASTVEEHGIRLKAEIRMVARPKPRVISLDVGGTRHTTMLSTLCRVEGSRLARMFDGVGSLPEPAAGGTEGVPGSVSSVYVPQASDGSYVIDRNGKAFAYVLDYLRDLQPPPLDVAAHDKAAVSGECRARAGGADEQPALSGAALVLPPSDHDLRRLAIEADFYGLPALAAACRAGSVFVGREPGTLPKITHSEFLAIINSSGYPGATVQFPRMSDLRNVSMGGLNLDGIILRECDLRGVDMRNTSLKNAHLQDAQLQGAHLQGADLTRANLCRANCQGANMQGVNLKEAQLCGTNCQGADMQRANLAGASLYGGWMMLYISPDSEDISEERLKLSRVFTSREPEAAVVATRFCTTATRASQTEILDWGDDFVQLEELILLNPDCEPLPAPVNVRNPGGSPWSGNPGEVVNNLLSSDRCKWLDTKRKAVEYLYDRDAPVRVGGFQVKTADDCPLRDPIKFKLEGLLQPGTHSAAGTGAAVLRDVDLRGATFTGAHTDGVDLRRANLQNAWGLNCRHVDLRGARLVGAKSLEGAAQATSFEGAIVDAETRQALEEMHACMDGLVDEE